MESRAHLVPYFQVLQFFSFGRFPICRKTSTVWSVLTPAWLCGGRQHDLFNRIPLPSEILWTDWPYVFLFWGGSWNISGGISLESFGGLQWSKLASPQMMVFYFVVLRYTHHHSSGDCLHMRLKHFKDDMIFFSTLEKLVNNEKLLEIAAGQWQSIGVKIDTLPAKTKMENIPRAKATRFIVFCLNVYKSIVNHSMRESQNGILPI